MNDGMNAIEKENEWEIERQDKQDSEWKTERDQEREEMKKKCENEYVNFNQFLIKKEWKKNRMAK